MKLKIEKDNLSKNEKIVVWVFIILGSYLLYFLVFGYNNKKEKTESFHFENYGKEVVAEITEKNIGRFDGLRFKYVANNKVYENSSTGGMARYCEVGEYYLAMYSTKDPKISTIFMSKPIIKSKRHFIEVPGVIKKIESYKTWKGLTFEFFIGGSLQKGFQYFDNIDNFKVGEQIQIYYKKADPEISFIKSHTILKEKTATNNGS